MLKKNLGRLIQLIEYDVIVIGAGISGVSCCIYLKRAGLNVLLVENKMVGGQLNKIDVIENYPGYKAVNGSDLAINLLEQINDIEINNSDISKIDYDRKEIILGKDKVSYKYLVFATGRREKLLGLDNEEDYIGRGISLCATCDGALYRDRDVIVIGGANSAVSEAIYLSNICNRVTLIYRNEFLRADNVLIERLMDKKNVNIIYNSNVERYIIKNGKIVGVKLDIGKVVDGECVFLAIGSVPNSELFVGYKSNGYIIVDGSYRTSIDDVYACGDVIKKEIYQLITASSEGVSVANSIIESNKWK